MIQFINNKGVNLEIPSNFIFSIEEALSVGLIYEKRIAILSDSSTLTISSEDMSIVDMSNFDNITIADTQYIDLDSIRCNVLKMDGHLVADNLYLYSPVFIVESEIEGECIYDWSIEGVDTYRISGDFYQQDESLQALLANKGFITSPHIQRAIYETNVREENVDYIMLNRKYKELLSEMMNIIDCKGSVGSMLDSLKWLEWGDMLTLREYWDKDDRSFYKDVDTIYTDFIASLVKTHTKTTAIGIHHVIRTINTDYGEVSREDVYQNKTGEGLNYPHPELSPILYDVIHQHTLSDIKLKMALIYNFFEQLFIPIHLDLISAVADDIVFGNDTKVFSGSGFDVATFTGDMRYTIYDADDKLYLGDVKCAAGWDVDAAVLWETGTTWDDVVVVGVDELFNIDVYDYHKTSEWPTDENDNIKDIRTTLMSYYNSKGAVWKLKIYTDGFGSGRIMQGVSVIITDSDNNLISKSSGRLKVYEDSIDINILFKDAGEYNISVILTPNEGDNILVNHDISIIDVTNNNFSINKLHRRDLYKEMMLVDLYNGGDNNCLYVSSNSYSFDFKNIDLSYLDTMMNKEKDTNKLPIHMYHPNSSNICNYVTYTKLNKVSEITDDYTILCPEFMLDGEPINIYKLNMLNQPEIIEPGTEIKMNDLMLYLGRSTSNGQYINEHTSKYIWMIHKGYNELDDFKPEFTLIGVRVTDGLEYDTPNITMYCEGYDNWTNNIFISHFWSPKFATPDTLLNLTTNDVLQLVPQYKTLDRSSTGGYVWRITNLSSGDIGYIRGYVNPYFYASNSDTITDVTGVYKVEMLYDVNGEEKITSCNSFVIS